MPAIGPGFGGQQNSGGRAAILLGGCYLEAMQANVVAGCIDNLRSCLAETYHAHMNGLAAEIRKCAVVLLHLHEQTHAHPSRIPVLLEYLDLVLPSFQRSCLDIKRHYEDTSKSLEMRWRAMYHQMTTEAGGLPLPQRFMFYYEILLVLGQMLTRSPTFDMNALEVLQNRLLELRDRQGIALPPIARRKSSGPGAAGVGKADERGLDPVQLTSLAAFREQNVHWAEDIFSRPLPCRTRFKRVKDSQCYGPWGDVFIPPDAKILFRRPFDQDRLSVLIYVGPQNFVPVIVIRSVDPTTGTSFYSMRSIHEVCVNRDGSCLVLKRWSNSESCSKLWALLYFLTWEELVLFHCTFVALKFEGDWTKKVNPEEFKPGRERRLFQASIIDDGFKHSLLVYQDVKSGGLRLHAAVWEGFYRCCPVWTAFITHQARSPTWLVRKDKHRVWLSDVLLYVFCNGYRQEHMRQNKTGAFELYFVSPEAAMQFKALFAPPAPPPPPPAQIEPASEHGRERPLTPVADMSTAMTTTKAKAAFVSSDDEDDTFNSSAGNDDDDGDGGDDGGDGDDDGDDGDDGGHGDDGSDGDDDGDKDAADDNGSNAEEDAGEPVSDAESDVESAANERTIQI